MAYNPGIQYRGDQYLSEGIGSLGESAADAIKKRQETEKNLATSDTIVQNAHQQGLLNDEEYDKYLSGSKTQKIGTAFGVVSNFHSNLQQALGQSQIDERKAQMQRTLEQTLMQQAQMNYQPSDAERQRGYAAGGEILQTGPGKFNFAPYGGGAGGADFTPKVTTLTDPATGKPFSLYSRGPNQVDLTPGSQGAHPMVGQPHYDPDTGEIDGTYRADGSVQYRPRQTPEDPIKAAIASQLSPSPTPAPAAAAATANPGLKALAAKALNDPAATPEQKAAAKKLLGL